MIEYKAKDTNPTLRVPTFWLQVPSGVTAETTKFNAFYYKIGNKIYFQDTKEFREAFNKERIWEMLND